MSNIPKPSSLNLAGVKYINYIFADEINNMPLPSDGEINLNDIILRSGAVWYNLYFTPGTLKGKVAQKQTEAGNIYNIDYSLSIPRDSVANTNPIDTMSRRPFIMLLMDNNNIAKVYGSKEKPLLAQYEIPKDGSPNGQNGYDISISGKTDFAPAYIVTF